MAIGTGSNARIAYIAEVTWGTTPATPVFKNLRVTSGGPRINKTTGRSNELTTDRNVRDEFLLGIDAGGTYPFELTYATFDDILEGAFLSTWATNVLKIGSTDKFYTFEEFLELGTTDSFVRFPGSYISAFRLDVAARSAVTGSFDIMSERVTTATAIITGATYTAANTNDVMQTATGFAGLAVTGVTTLPKIRRISFELNNSLRVRPSLNKGAYSEQFGYGYAEVTGTIEAYFESNELLDAIIAHTGGSIAFTLGTVTAQKYTITIPAVEFLNGARQIGGANDDVIYEVPFRGIYHAGSATSLQITRAVA